MSKTGLTVRILESGFDNYSVLQDSFQSRLLSVSSIDSVKAGFDSLFTPVVDIVRNNKVLYCILEKPVAMLPVEMLGGDDILYKNTNILFLVNLGSILQNRNVPDSRSLAVIQRESAGFIDSIEYLAIRESGIELKKPEESTMVHLQKDLYYDALSGKAYLDNKDFRDVIGQYSFIFLSSGSAGSLDYSSLGAALFDKNVTAIIVNRAQIRDINCAVLDKRLYSDIRDGETVEQSFYDARILLYKNMKYEHPSYWLYNRLYVSGVGTD